MESLSEQAILSIWEMGQRPHPIQLALKMLAIALPELSSDELLALDIGQRDAHLLTLRERTFGGHFAGFAECARCKERLEFTFDAATIREQGQVAQEEKELTVQLGEYELQAHLPTCADLLAITHCRSVSTARSMLIQRCVQHVSCAGEVVTVDTLPEQVIGMLGEQMLELSPQSEILIDLACPACQYEWSILFDIVTFLWSEIRAHAKRVLREVYILAKAYGWREVDILAMSTVRRQFYLEMVSQ